MRLPPSALCHSSPSASHPLPCVNSQTVTSRRFYYDCLMKPNAKSVTTALRKVENLPFNTIANGHGPILR